MQPDEDDSASGQPPEAPASSTNAGKASGDREAGRSPEAEAGRSPEAETGRGEEETRGSRDEEAGRGSAAGPGDERESRRERGARRADGRSPDRVDGLRAAVLVFARSRLAPLSAEDAAAIAALTDERELTELVDTLAQAASVEEARAVLAAAIAGTRT